MVGAEGLIYAGPSRNRPSGEPENSFLALIGNTALLGAVLVYMGWNYENSLLNYFQVPAFSLGIGTGEFALKGLAPLFDSDAVFIGILLVAVLGLASKASAVRELMPATARTAADRIPKAPGLALIAGLLVTVVILSVTWPNVSSGSFVGWFTSHRDRVYLVLALLAAGQLLTAWPLRHSRTGSFVYPLALIMASMCTLWAAGIYSGHLGDQQARSLATRLPEQTAVTVYSVVPLGLSGPGVTCRRVPGVAGYPYVCVGLRLLYVQSGTYDLLPVGWTAHDGQTFILDDSNRIRIELSPGLLPASIPSRAEK